MSELTLLELLLLFCCMQLEEEETPGSIRLSKFLPLMTQNLVERRLESITVFTNHFSIEQLVQSVMFELQYCAGDKFQSGVTD